MKKYFFVFIFLMFSFSFNSYAQLVVENFSYSTGQLTDLNGGANVSGGNWINFSGTANPLQVVSGSLSYFNYPSSGIDNKVTMISGTGEDAYISFSSVNNEKVYASFLINLSSTSGLPLNTSTAGDYFIAFLPSSSTTTFVGRVSIKKGSIANTYNLGLKATSSNTAQFISTDFDLEVTHLIVICYEFIDGESNDIVKMWIDPDLSGNEPAADITQTTSSETTNLSRFALRQDAVNSDVDGIRIATSWSLAPLPVELSSFSAYLNGNIVNLKWQTKTEVENYGFEIERAAFSASPSTDWLKIGFVSGSGNSNSPKDYTFVDKTVSSGKYIYRLKQIDVDGKFEYSKAVEVDLGKPELFYLGQNYPNPFNPTTKINYSLPTDAEVKLAVYNLEGELIKSLVNEKQAAGSYSIDFNADALASGMYIYKLIAKDFIQIKKMLLTK